MLISYITIYILEVHKMTSINPYLSFNDNCADAFNFYKSVFGGEFTIIQRFKDVPAEHLMAESEGEKIMHVSLPIGQHSVLMGSDTPQGMGKPTPGSNYSISVSPDSLDEATRLFNGLSDGGK